MLLLKKLNFVSRQTVIVLGCLFFMIALVSSTVNTFTLYGSPLKTVAVIAVTLGLFLIMAYLVTYYSSRLLFLIILASVALILRILWILWINTPPASDFSFIHTAAVSAASGDFSFADTDYFASWVYQLGFTMYEALMIKLFGNSILILKLLNVVISVGTAVIVYFTAAKAFNETCGRLASVLYALYIPNILMCSVLTNQHLSTFFFMLGCLLLLNKGWNIKYRWIFIGLSFGLGNVMRPLGSIFLIGFVVFIVLVHLHSFSKKQAWPILGRIAGILAVFYLFQSLVSYSFIYGGVTQYPLSNREPYWKVMVGLNSETNGSWSLKDVQYQELYKLGEERNRLELAVIKERLADKPAVATLMLNKLVFLWGAGDSSTMWSMWGINKPDLNVLLNKFERMMYMMMSAFGVLSLIALLRARHSEDSFLFIILLLGYAAIHLVIEVQTRYRLDLMPAFIILQSYGLYTLYVKIQSLSKRQGISREDYKSPSHPM